MFNGKKKSQAVELATLVGRDTEINGNLIFRGALHVEGRVKGDITAASEDAEALLTIGERGVIEGEIRVPKIILDGTVVGNIYSVQMVELETHAKVIGNLHYHRLEMALGAEVNGQLIPERNIAPSDSVQDEKIRPQ